VRKAAIMFTTRTCESPTSENQKNTNASVGRAGQEMSVAKAHAVVLVTRRSRLALQAHSGWGGDAAALRCATMLMRPHSTRYQVQATMQVYAADMYNSPRPMQC